MNINKIKGRCRIVDGHWLWTGAMSNTLPRIHAPDYTGHNGAMTTQTGRRAVWHVKTGKAIPAGWRVFGTCSEAACVNPAHMVCHPTAKQGALVAASGHLRGSVTRIAANRASSRKRTTLTSELVAWINASPQTCADAAHGLGISVQAVSKYRTGRGTAFEPVGGLFTGLMAANQPNRRATA